MITNIRIEIVVNVIENEPDLVLPVIHATLNVKKKQSYRWRLVIRNFRKGANFLRRL